MNNDEKMQRVQEMHDRQVERQSNIDIDEYVNSILNCGVDIPVPMDIFHLAEQVMSSVSDPYEGLSIRSMMGRNEITLAYRAICKAILIDRSTRKS